MDNTNSLLNSRHSRSLLTTRAYGLTVAMATIKAGLAVLDGNHLHGGNIYLWPVTSAWCIITHSNAKDSEIDLCFSLLCVRSCFLIFLCLAPFSLPLIYITVSSPEWRLFPALCFARLWAQTHYVSDIFYFSELAFALKGKLWFYCCGFLTM